MRQSMTLSEFIQDLAALSEEGTLESIHQTRTNYLGNRYMNKSLTSKVADLVDSIYMSAVNNNPDLIKRLREVNLDPLELAYIESGYQTEKQTETLRQAAQLLNNELYEGHSEDEKAQKYLNDLCNNGTSIKNALHALTNTKHCTHQHKKEFSGMF